MHRTLRLPALLAAFAATLTLAACGSSGDGQGTTGSAASQDTTTAASDSLPGGGGGGSFVVCRSTRSPTCGNGYSPS